MRKDEANNKGKQPLEDSVRTRRLTFINMMSADSPNEWDLNSYRVGRSKCSCFFRGCKMEDKDEDMAPLEADERYFIRNGALLLEKQIALHQGKGTESEPLKIFSAKEIRHATNNFDHNLIVARAISTVYRGTLDGRTVAVKTARSLPPCEGVIENYLNQVTMKQLIHHKNVEKLHGCCLETRVPIVVAEYIPNFSLFTHLHAKEKVDPVRSSIPWHDLLKIATEISYALSYMHLAFPKPIVHMDVRSSGVLLDDSFTSKLSSFGFSLSIPPGEDFISQVVIGTPGYIDPEYQRTRRVTEKCDVYSFGVLLVELLTGKDPTDMFNNNSSLADCFVSSMGQNDRMEMVQSGVIAEASRSEIEAVAAIAVKCLHSKGDERPTMREAATDLRRIRRLSVSNQNNIAGSASAP